MIKRLGHPSRRKLQRWLEATGDDVDTRVDRHLGTCEYCAERLETVALRDDTAPIASALVKLLVVPDELPDRLRTTIDERLSNQRDLTLIGEFLSIPLQTARVITTNDLGEK